MSILDIGKLYIERLEIGTFEVGILLFDVGKLCTGSSIKSGKIGLLLKAPGIWYLILMLVFSRWSLTSMVLLESDSDSSSVRLIMEPSRRSCALSSEFLQTSGLVK